MGVVHGKSVDSSDDKDKGFAFKQLNARVDHIFVDGLCKTKDDIIVKAVNELFRVTNFEEMLQESYSIKTKLEKLGCFDNIAVHVDTSSGPRSTPEYGYDITFKVRELKQLAGSVHTLVGSDNEGLVVVAAKVPNVLGRGESVQGEFSYGNKQTKNLNVSLSKPLLISKYVASISASIFGHIQEWPMSKYRLGENGLVLDFSFHSLKHLKHSLQWEGVIRELSVGNRFTAFEVRENAGSTLKSSIKHILTYDTRKSFVFPSSGLLAKITSELAGVGGNVGFFKNYGQFQVDIPIMTDVVLQGTVGGGVMIPVDPEKKDIVICDNFFLGGPVTFRGFEFRGVGPVTDGSFIGAKMYWCAGLSLFTPLPFRPSVGGFGEYFRTQFFANVGNIGHFNIGDSSSLMNNARFAYGIGLALRIAHFARVELNYCFPTWIQDGDRAVHGVQIGIGTSL